MVAAVAVAVAIPLAFLYLVRWLDLYASGSFRTVLLCLAWGLVAFYGALQVNSFVLSAVGFTILTTVVAPVVEEFLKSLALVYLVRRPQFTYFVDGAIYGFASGTAFAVLENLLYLGRLGEEAEISVALGRAFSTALMHGSASVLVGVALGRLRFTRGPSRVGSLLLGWSAAIALHMGYNNAVMGSEGAVTLLAAMGIGFGGLALTAAFILCGLREERIWLQQTLGLEAGVSSVESAVIQKMEDLDILLEPIGARFGQRKREQVKAFLQLQARLGLKLKVQALTPDAGLRGELAQQIAALRQEMDLLRRDVGVYCMSYLRSILPPETEPVWARLGEVLSAREATPSKPSLWSSLGERLERKEEGKP